MSNLKQEQEKAAIDYAEMYGLVEYKVQGWFIIYNKSYRAYLDNPRYTIQFKVDLRTKEVVERKRLKRFDPKGLLNI